MCTHKHLATSLCGFFVFNGSIQDIRACQRPKRKRWESSLLKGQESYMKLPLFTPVTKWTCLNTNCLPIRSWAKCNGTDWNRKRDAAYFYSVHLLPQLFLPFLLPPHNINTDTWIGGLLCVWSKPSEHNERLSSQIYGKYFFQIFTCLVNCLKLDGDSVISHMIYLPCSFVLLSSNGAKH